MLVNLKISEKELTSLYDRIPTRALHPSTQHPARTTSRNWKMALPRGRTVPTRFRCSAHRHAQRMRNKNTRFLQLKVSAKFLLPAFVR